MIEIPVEIDDELILHLVEAGPDGIIITLSPDLTVRLRLLMEMTPVQEDT